MTEGRALLLAGIGHIALFAALSLAVISQKPLLASFAETTPVEVVTIADTPSVTETPKPSMAAAPQETVEAAAPPTEAAPTDTSAQDAIAPEPVKPAKPTPPAPKPLDTSSLANLIDKALPKAAVKPRDTSAFAKSIESAIPKGARLDARATASLEQAIRTQIAPCWNPPIGGADVRGMTAVLRIRLNRDGSVMAAPEFVSQTGATAANAAYARAFVETARRAVLRCAPLQLPADMFAYWREFELNFDPSLMT
ncbi:TonB C-terminal domain-containing protein [Sandaracinobacteroides saxicola]|uniref:Cell division and transport-associated protein TolA n=1 Tax=Sandaracinobacteroides saxicola TaxID=2759707 RepID=A0A7G5IJE7_9SPHN|nr:TonB C-terminal domain-containing protein [Sandaracinobacteroides saxicola]QMW23489.1 hypothetical protein H3309_03020 [Sandaracinobacteroides saxicola]